MPTLKADEIADPNGNFILQDNMTCKITPISKTDFKVLIEFEITPILNPEEHSGNEVPSNYIVSKIGSNIKTLPDLKDEIHFTSVQNEVFLSLMTKVNSTKVESIGFINEIEYKEE